MSTALHDAVAEAIGEVLDPCSRFLGSNISFADLGMIDAIEVTPDGVVRLTLLLDDPTCLYIVEIEHGLRTAAMSVPGVTDVDISIRWDELWTPERMSPRAQARMPRLPLPVIRTGGQA